MFYRQCFKNRQEKERRRWTFVIITLCKVYGRVTKPYQTCRKIITALSVESRLIIWLKVSHYEQKGGDYLLPQNAWSSRAPIREFHSRYWEGDFDPQQNSNCYTKNRQEVEFVQTANGNETRDQHHLCWRYERDLRRLEPIRFPVAK